VVARALVVIIWHILATGKPYHELGADYFTRRGPWPTVTGQGPRARLGPFTYRSGR
jgi:hypothetical protein